MAINAPVAGSGGTLGAGPYYYEVTGTHGGWTSPPSSAAMYVLGWNVGGWQ